MKFHCSGFVPHRKISFVFVYPTGTTRCPPLNSDILLSTPQSTGLVTSKCSEGIELIIVKVQARYNEVLTVIVNIT